MGKPIAYLRTPLLMALGEDPSGLAVSVTNSQLDSMIVGSIMMGLGPDCLKLVNNNTEIEPEDANNDTIGYLILKTAYLVQGGDTPVDVKTRAMSVSVNASNRRETLYALEQLIGDLEGKGNICGAGNSSTVITSNTCATYFGNYFPCFPYNVDERGIPYQQSI